MTTKQLHINIIKNIIGIVLVGLFPVISWAQEVTVSPEISLRDMQGYDIIGDVNGTILLYQDRGRDQQVMLFDENLVLQSERQVNLAFQRPRVYEIVNLDTAFGVIYGYREEDEHIIRMDIMSEKVELQDSVILAKSEKEFRGLEFETELSEDQSVIALYNVMDQERLKLMVYDFEKDTTVQSEEYLFANASLYDDLISINVTNDGEVFLLNELNNIRSKKEDHTLLVYHFRPFEKRVSQIEIPLPDIVTADVKLTIDNRNKQIGIAGLYDEKRFNESEGYFFVSGQPREFADKPITFTPFDKNIFFEVYGEKDEKRLENFSVKDVVWKANGSAILVFEMSLDVSRGNGPIRRGGRRVGGAAVNYFGPTSSSYWSDHYREDLVLISLSDKGEMDWHRVLYKKQFSQNDNGVYSSYFPFMTPSRLRLIYNDEIKNNSTVSEYILDPKGNYKRTSVLSTEYQNLRLRFEDAEQISGTQLIVPSQKSYGLNLVKIDFGV